VDGGDVVHAVSLVHPTITVSTQSVQAGSATNVHLDVTVPDDLLGSHYPVTTEVWSGPARTGVLYASQSGWSGNGLTLQFKLPVS
jgi:hypothetical protein